MKSVSENTSLSKDLFHQFPWSQSASLSTMIPFGGCWRSAAAAAQGSIPAEADGICYCYCYCCCSVMAKDLGKCQFVIDRALSWSCCCCCCYKVASVVSDSVRPHRGRQPTRLFHPWGSPGKNTSGLPLPSPMHESEKWKWSRSVMSDSSRPHGL